MPNDGPGLHAILIGVSEYDLPVAGAQQRPFAADSLEGPARTVVSLAEWLRDGATQLSVPLKTLRLLASPSARERAEVPALAECTPATQKEVVNALREWCVDASKRADDMTFFYFAGHGIQRSRTDTVMLLQDFNRGFTLLENSVALGNVYGGMGSTRGLPNLARTQWFFADCCRSAVDALTGYELAPTAEVFSPEANLADDRRAPIFLAANSGRETFTLDGQCTMFGADLLACLKGLGAEQKRVDNHPPRWLVSAYTLADSMARLADEYNVRIKNIISEYNIKNPNNPIAKDYKRTPVPTLVSDPVLNILAQPPMVPCTFLPEPSALVDLLGIHFGPYAAEQTVYKRPFNEFSDFKQVAGYYKCGTTIVDTTNGERMVMADQPLWVGPPFCIIDLPM